MSVGLDGGMCPDTAIPASLTTAAPTKERRTWAPTYHPTREPTPYPTREPTPYPTREPTPYPTSEPTVKYPILILSTPRPSPVSEELPVFTPSPSISLPEKDVLNPTEPPVNPTEPPKKPNLYDRTDISQAPVPTPDSFVPEEYEDEDFDDRLEEEQGGEAINGASGPLLRQSDGESIAMIFCAVSVVLFTTCCMLAVFRWNQRRMDEQKRNLRFLEYSASSQIKLYMQDPV